jgi:pimeloyl-ACP methyl ester carboxylesterase
MLTNASSFPFTDDNGTVWLAFADWGVRAGRRPIICVHGLTRQGRDFDELAHRLSSDFKVIEVDVVGRGKSGWLADKQAYNYDTYLRHIDGLLDYRAVDACDWIGTSMGGILGMLLAAQEETPIRRLILNDVGPYIPKAALERIGEYVGENPSFANLQEALAYFQKVHADFGDLTEVQWSDLTMHSVQREADGSYRLHYDPAIGDPFKGEQKDVDLWEIYDQIKCPTLVLRGANSGLLTRETAEEMTRRGPMAELIEFPNCGHAPSLMEEAQIEAVQNWLLIDHFGEFEEEEAEEPAEEEEKKGEEGGDA